MLVRLDRATVFASMQAVLWPLALGAALVVLPLVAFIIWSTRRLHMDEGRFTELNAVETG